MADSSLPPVNTDDGVRDPNVGEPLHDDVRYDETDVAVSHIVGILVAIALVFAAVGIICWWLLRMRSSGPVDSAPASSYRAPNDKLPPAPRLEPLDRSEATAASEVFAKQLALERALHHYGDTSESGFVHIPIEEAMKRVIAGLPVRTDAQLPATGFGLIGSGESNSGRLYSEAPSWLREKK
jgi:hypothetical protein